MISNKNALAFTASAVSVRKGVRPGPAWRRLQEVIREVPIAAGHVGWELDFDVVAHPVAVARLWRLSLVDTWR